MPIRFPDLDASSRTGFAGNKLDRISERRNDTAFINGLRAREDARIVLFADDRPVLRVDGGDLEAVFPFALAERFEARVDEAVLLGLESDGAPVFGALVGRAPDPDMREPDFRPIDLRSLAIQGVLSPHALGVLAQGRSLTHWHQRHGFCANCGVRTTVAQGGYRRDCPGCKAHHFPRTDPVVIMLAIDGERCLLGRQHRFQPGMYSCLAGFVEPGESLESAVRREIREEAGITVGKVGYHASQPWPFPATLMIGCFGEAEDFAIVREEDELEDARWFDRAELLPMIERRHPEGLFAPPPMAIAHHLIRAFAEEGVPPRGPTLPDGPHAAGR